MDELGQEAFQRVSDIHKVETTTLLAYKLMARNFRSPENDEFMILMDKLMSERPDKQVLLSKKAKLELFISFLRPELVQGLPDHEKQVLPDDQFQGSWLPFQVQHTCWRG